jgi:hypothetical protein
MEFISSIQMLVYPAAALFIFILSAVMLRTKGAIFFIAAFGINFINSALWRILPLLQNSLHYTNLTTYSIIGTVGFILYIISSVLFIVGIIFLSKNQPANITGL